MATNHLSDDTDPHMQMIHSLRAVTVELDLFGAEFARQHGLHTTDLRALIHLLDAARSGTVATPGWLGGQLGLNSASTTALIDRLTALGYVRRERDLVDRRRVLLVVDDRAKALGTAFFGPLMTQMITAMEVFSDNEKSSVRRFLDTMRDVVINYRLSHDSVDPF